MGFSTNSLMDDDSVAYRIECLQGKKVLDARSLWEEVFSEDSKAFLDYYFANKALSNTAFICRHLPTGQIVSMVHLTPYEMTIEKTNVPTFYIVGVATKKSHRHRKLMSTLLNKSFDYASHLQCPFVFLMPANPAIYEPFGFSYVYSRPQYSIPEVIGRKEVYISHFPAVDIQIQRLEKEASPQILAALSNFARKTLADQYDYYLTRTPAYYGTLLLELYSQNGCIYAFTLNNRLEGYFLYTEEENNPFIQELLFSHKLQSYINSTDYVNRHGHTPSAARMATLFPMVLSERKPIIMAKNLFPDSTAPSLCAASAAVPGSESQFPSPFQATDYVNYLFTHKGFINEIL